MSTVLLDTHKYRKMAGSCFRLYYKDNDFASVDRVQKKVHGLAAKKQLSRPCSWLSRTRNGWELFLDPSIIPSFSSRNHHGKRKKNRVSTGMILLTHSSLTEFEHIGNTEKIALNHAIGFVPKWCWAGCAMCNDPIDIDGLHFLLNCLVAEFGGHQKLSRIDSDLGETNTNCIHKIEFRDYESYFGNGEIQMGYEQYIPLKNYYMIDLGKTNYRRLDY
ncbi:MAG: hypothetical protein AB3N10_14800 [Allomuricauda sp.]